MKRLTIIVNPQIEDGEKLALPEHAWPVEWLRRIARYPHENGTWLGGAYAMIANGEPPQPFAPNTKLSCMLAMTEETEFGWLDDPGNKKIAFYTIYPIYVEERDLERSAGVNQLLQLFMNYNISTTVSIHRENVAVKQH
jgi:hypothetical protein